MNTPVQKAVTGCLLGTVVGDALGLPGEGLSRRLTRMLPNMAQMHFLGDHGMVSGATEHACLVGMPAGAPSGG